MVWNIPIALTTFRLLAAPGVAVIFLYFNRPWADWFALVLFVSVALTDWFDGYLARLWGQTTKFGAMLDPIADKAMVVIALAVILGYSSMSPWLVLPATVIMFRELFVSGVREFLGQNSSALKTTFLAKFKTTLQMVAISALFAQGVFEHYIGLAIQNLDPGKVSAILAGEAEDMHGLLWKMNAMGVMENCGIYLLWAAAALTLVTGLDYFIKSLPFFRE
ncbi:MAG: CDP-diacylglycerol--glycerol-3-phosphate 3-phosphatidyltransferase [Roseovarius sp.]|nr:CDP-diacylglycerol--glycerol-3-phosphate 3-phosphatidyltransferase [Roseovarius sp.]